MKIMLCQKNPVTGDVAGNTRIILATLADTRSEHPDLIIFSELFRLLKILNLASRKVTI